MKKIAASELVLDYQLYPRQELDQENVERLREALRAGAVFPPILADQSSRRVVDGFHRVMAITSEAGPDALISVKFENYFDDGELFLAAIKANAGHGVALNQQDAALCLTRGEELGLSRQMIAGALAVTQHTADRLAPRQLAGDAKLSFRGSQGRASLRARIEGQGNGGDGYGRDGWHKGLPDPSAPSADDWIELLAAAIGDLTEWYQLYAASLGKHDVFRERLDPVLQSIEALTEQPWLPTLLAHKKQVTVNPWGLTPRELEILELLSQGANNDAIAEKLVVGLKSVENYINSVYQQMFGDYRDLGKHLRVTAALAGQRWLKHRGANSEPAAAVNRQLVRA